MSNSSQFSDQLKQYLERGNYSLIEKLLKNGLNANYILDPNNGFSLLHFAVGFDNCHQKRVVQTLLNYEANANLKSKNGLTPLQLCIIWNRHELVHILMSKANHQASDWPNFRPVRTESSISSIEDLSSLLIGLNDAFCDETTASIITESLDLSLNAAILQTDQSDSITSCSDFQSELGLYVTARESIESEKINKLICALQCLKNEEIFAQLKTSGQDPGPITNDVRAIYIRKLARLKANTTHKPQFEGYPTELNLVLRNTMNVAKMISLDHEISSDFGRPDPKRNWREGTKKNCFNYLLLDPRITQRLPSRCNNLPFAEQFITFVKSVFYVGKGQSNRPFEHLIDALKDVQSKNKLSDKVSQIISIWDDKLGVICVRCFQNAIPTEAFTREACIIDAFDLNNLKNEKRGKVYGKATHWSGEIRRTYGTYLIKRAFHLFINDGERQILPQDLKK